MLRVGVPNKGALSQPAIDLLSDADYRVRRLNRELSVLDPRHRIQFFYLRPRDIAVYVGDGMLDLGITGRDLFLDSTAQAKEVCRLGFARSQFRFAARPGTIAKLSNATTGEVELSRLSGLRIATSFPRLMAKFLADKGIQAELIKLDGAVENAVELGSASVIVDVVETGTSLRNAGLAPFGAPLMDSEGIIIRGADPQDHPVKERAVRVLLERVQGVLDARRFVLLDYDCPDTLLEKAFAITPGRESPTVSPLSKPGWSAVRSLVERRDLQHVMDKLTALGATAILSTRLEGCRI
ncbi:ATP phosphoribosyltransferase [Amycolatopsis thermoflava]